jgi:membrane protein DedA with SNARE-associated domain
MSLSETMVLAPVDIWLREHLYGVVFLGAVVDALGIPFPGRIMLITAGSLSGPAADREADAWMVVALAVAGTVVGDHGWYLVGRLAGRRLLERYCRIIRLPQGRIAAADRVLRRFGGLALVIGRFAASIRIVVTPLAVSRGMSYGRFLAYDLLGAVLWVSGFVWLGRAAGAVGAKNGLVGVLTALSALCLVSILVSVMTRRWLAGRARVS